MKRKQFAQPKSGRTSEQKYLHHFIRGLTPAESPPRAGKFPVSAGLGPGPQYKCSVLNVKPGARAILTPPSLIASVSSHSLADQIPKTRGGRPGRRQIWGAAGIHNARRPPGSSQQCSTPSAAFGDKNELGTRQPGEPRLPSPAVSAPGGPVNGLLTLLLNVTMAWMYSQDKECMA
jgi:hypothetical protein